MGGRRYVSGEKRKIIIDFIKKNPNVTHNEIKKKTKLHVGREFKGGMQEAFKEARVKPPRNFKIKSLEERKRILIDYVRKNPKVGGHIIARDTKINLFSTFSTTKALFEAAGVKYPRIIDKREGDEKKRQVIEFVKSNPLASISEIISVIKIQPYRFFKNIGDIYLKADVKNIPGHAKRTLKKQEEIIYFIKKNPLATQREINKSCNTKVQHIFDRGIFEAYEKAGIKYPFERLKLYGVGLKEIRERAKSFEEEIAVKLSGYGNVNRLVKTKRGIADAILERKDKKIVIEIKDYCAKEISISQIRQLNKYLEDIGCNLGILICRNKPQKHKFLIGKNKIFVLDDSELDKISHLIKGSVV